MLLISLHVLSLADYFANRQNFARREMGMVLGTVLNRYDLYRGQEGPTFELYDTSRERDIVASSEMIIPMPARGSHGLRVKIRH